MEMGASCQCRPGAREGPGRDSGSGDSGPGVRVRVPGRLGVTGTGINFELNTMRVAPGRLGITPGRAATHAAQERQARAPPPPPSSRQLAACMPALRRTDCFPY